MKYIKLSVHDLVDFVLRSGSIDNRYFNNETMQEGTRIHSKYQNNLTGDYLNEVYLSHIFSFEDYQFEISGRCDCLLKIGESIFIEEIKSTNQSIQIFFEENKKWHLGQAEVYGLIYCLNNDLESINIRLTYISQINEKALKYDYKYTKNLLQDKVNSYFQKYIYFLDSQDSYLVNKKDYLSNLKFPFNTYRKGQANLIETCYNSLNNDYVQLIEAPTGIGKTISILYAALKLMKTDEITKVFYLTAKNSGFEACLDASKLLSTSSYYLRTIVIYAKEKSCICLNVIKQCNPDFCPFAKDYYTKLFDALFDALNSFVIFDHNVVLDLAKKRDICPFEFSLDLSNWCDIVICDYNYIFHPISKFQRYCDDGNLTENKSILLIDEAHNLIDRSRNMYSASLSTIQIDKAIYDFKGKRGSSIKKNLIKIKNILDSYASLFEKDTYLQCSEIDEKLITELNNFRSLSDKYKKKDYILTAKNYNALSIDVYRFLTIFDFYNKNYAINILKNNDDYEYRLDCLNPTKYISDDIYSFKSSILFSGTLSPNKYYGDLILNNNDYKYNKFESPYNDKNFKILVNNNISIKYKDRINTIDQVVESIYSFISPKKGNYLVFLPSFVYLDLLKEKINNDDRFAYKVLFQSSNMTNEEKDCFLNEFSENNEETLIGFCVIGGSFSEAINLEKDKLIGTVIVGVGHPSINFLTTELFNYYNDSINGYDYIYTYPGINKIRQAVGRVIRGEDDRGMALLIDSRYSWTKYSFLFKDVFKNYEFVKTPKQISDKVNNFYK